MSSHSKSSSTFASTITLRLFGAILGMASCAVGIASIRPHQWAAFRQAIPVAMSLAEAEDQFKQVAKESQKTITDLSDQSNHLGQLDQVSDENRLISLLRSQATDYQRLRSQFEVLQKQCKIFEEAVGKEFAGWADEAEQMNSVTVRIKEQQKIVAREIAYQEKLANAKSDLMFVERVLKEGGDIERLARCVEHELAITQSLEGLGSLTKEVMAFAKRMQGTTQSVLLAWK